MNLIWYMIEINEILLILISIYNFPRTPMTRRRWSAVCKATTATQTTTTTACHTTTSATRRRTRGSRSPRTTASSGTTPRWPSERSKVNADLTGTNSLKAGTRRAIIIMYYSSIIIFYIYTPHHCWALFAPLIILTVYFILHEYFSHCIFLRKLELKNKRKNILPLLIFL